MSRDPYTTLARIVVNDELLAGCHTSTLSHPRARVVWRQDLLLSSFVKGARKALVERGRR